MSRIIAVIIIIAPIMTFSLGCSPSMMYPPIPAKIMRDVPLIEPAKAVICLKARVIANCPNTPLIPQMNRICIVFVVYNEKSSKRIAGHNINVPVASIMNSTVVV